MHSVNEKNLTAGVISINEGALLLTGLNNDRGSLELMYSGTPLPGTCQERDIKSRLTVAQSR